MYSSAIIVHIGAKLGYITIRNEIKTLVTVDFFIKKIAILALLQSLTLNFGNRAFYHLSVSLIQMLKAFTPVMTMFLLFLTKQEQFNLYLIISIFLLSFGTAITSFGVSDRDHSLIGFLYCAGAQGTEAIKLVLKQKLLQGFKINSNKNNINNNVNAANEPLINNNSKNSYSQPIKQTTVKFSIFEGLYYYTPITFLFMCILAIPLELSNFINNYNENINIIYTNWYLFILAGILGFGTNVAAFLVTKVISALYLKALGAFRSVCLVGFAVVLFNEIVTRQQMFGYFITLTGFTLYNYVKMTK